ncbi:MAG: pyridoxal-phosphate dependent enzyme, partial [Polyangiales bacterium]
MTVTIDDIRRAHDLILPSIVRTPFELSETLSVLTGVQLYLKFENQQFTASFKERGALHRLLGLNRAERARGVIAMSAGNHAQALAYHGKRLEIPTTIVMPRTTPNSKVEQTRAHGAEVILHGSQFDETRAFTQELARERDLTLVHPYDDPA